MFSLFDTELVRSFTKERQTMRSALIAWSENLLKAWNSGWKDTAYFNKIVKPSTKVQIGSREVGAEELRKFFHNFFIAFQDVKVEIESRALDEVVNTVGLTMKVKAKHVGEWKGVKPTNKETSFRIFDFFHLALVPNQIESSITTMQSHMEWLN